MARAPQPIHALHERRLAAHYHSQQPAVRVTFGRWLRVARRSILVSTHRAAKKTPNRRRGFRALGDGPCTCRESPLAVA